MYVNVVSSRKFCFFFKIPCGYLRDRLLPTGFEKSSECYSYSASAVFSAGVMEKERLTEKYLNGK